MAPNIKSAAKNTKRKVEIVTRKKSLVKLTDTEKVAVYMKELEHPLKEEIEAVRSIIKNSNKNISERIKWNAPSYYYKEDLVTFNARATEKVHLVFHHPAIVKIKSPILEGNYPDRRMTYFTSMADIKKKTKELKKILNELVDLINK